MHSCIIYYSLLYIIITLLFQFVSRTYRLFFYLFVYFRNNIKNHPPKTVNPKQTKIDTTNRQIFIFGLWNIIQTYQPNPLAALLYFITASCAAFAFVSTYLLAIFGAAAGGVYGVVKLAESNRRIEAARNNNGAGAAGGYRRAPQQNVWNRPHYQ